MADVEIRQVRDEELDAVAGLRWQWVLENGQRPSGRREEFVRRFVAWARQHAASHRCLVVRRDECIVGMAWLAILQRVPTPSAPLRASGDLQSVYVVPRERNKGLGGQMIDHALLVAQDLGLERVTVHSSAEATAAYSRYGFLVSPRLLQISLGGAG